MTGVHVKWLDQRISIQEHLGSVRTLVRRVQSIVDRSSSGAGYVVGFSRNGIVYPTTFIVNNASVVAGQTFDIVLSQVKPQRELCDFPGVQMPSFSFEDLPSSLRIRDPFDYDCFAEVRRNDIHRVLALKRKASHLDFKTLLKVLHEDEYEDIVDRRRVLKAVAELGLWELEAAVMVMWGLFDRNSDGWISEREFLSGMLALICGGREGCLDDWRCVFNMFCEDGRLSERNMFQHLKAMLLMFIGLARMDWDSKPLHAFVDRVVWSGVDLCFDIAGVEDNRSLCFEEFIAFIQGSARLLPWIMLIFVKADENSELKSQMSDSL